MIKEKQWVIYHQPCPDCGSSDGLSIDSEGNGYCFAHSKFYPDYYKDDKSLIEQKEALVEFEYYPDRGLHRSTLEFFDISTKFVDGEPTETAFKWPNGGLRIRRLGDVPKKDRFYSKGSMNNPGLLFTDKFDPGSKDAILITKSGYDAASAYEILNKQVATVSVTSESTAKRDVIQSWDYVNSFKKIYICMDNDEQGRKATAEVAPLFDYQRVYHIQVTSAKDINELYTQGKSADFKRMFENAKRFAPDNLISSFDQIKASLRKDKESQIATYPFKVIQEATYGLHEGEVILVKAPTTVGKTEFLRAIEHHILKTTTTNIGIIHLEEDNATTIKAIAGYELSVPATLPDCGLSEEDILDGYRRAVKDDENRVHIYISFDREDEDLLFGTIRFLVVAAGCKIIFFDHITWLGVGRDSEDERRKLDRVSQGLKLLAKELRFCLVLVSQMNSLGASRGSKNIDFTANTAITLSRDVTSPVDTVQRTTNFMLEKVRLGGRTGPSGYALFDRETGKLEDLSSDEGLILDHSKMMKEVQI